MGVFLRLVVQPSSAFDACGFVERWILANKLCTLVAVGCTLAAASNFTGDSQSSAVVERTAYLVLTFGDTRVGLTENTEYVVPGVVSEVGISLSCNRLLGQRWCEYRRRFKISRLITYTGVCAWHRQHIKLPA